MHCFGRSMCKDLPEITWRMHVSQGNRSCHRPIQLAHHPRNEFSLRMDGWTNSTIHKLLFGWSIGLLVEPTISFCSQELFGRRSDPPVGLATPRMHSNHCFWRNRVREQCYELPITLRTLRRGRRSNEKGGRGYWPSNAPSTQYEATETPIHLNISP